MCFTVMNTFMRHILTQYICVICSTVLLVNCSEKENSSIVYNSPSLYFQNAIKLEGEPLPTQYIAENQFVCYYSEYGFLGNMSLENKKQIHLADLKTGEIKTSTCLFGRGPGEILIKSPEMSLYKNSLFLLDQRTDRVKKVEIAQDSLKVEELFKLESDTPSAFLELETVSDSLFAILSYSFNNENNLILVDNHNNIFDSEAYRLLDNKKIDYSRFRYNVDIKISPCRKYLFVRGDYNSISKYTIENNNLTLQKHIFLVEPLYEIKNKLPIKKGNYLELNPNIFIGNEYIYIVANPESRQDFKDRAKKSISEGIRPNAIPENDSYILVLDYDFNFVKSYQCDCNTLFLALSPTPSTVYATDMINNRLIKYTLNGLN